MGKTIAEKIWDEHLIHEREDGMSLLYIDRHLTHEVTSPVAFESLREKRRKLRRPELTFGFVDHNVPTRERSNFVNDEFSLKQIQEIRRNAEEFGFTLFDYLSDLQGIVHVSAPELGLTLPGITIACGDSHTSTHGALGALAFGIGTSEGEHLFATQCIWVKKPRQMRVNIEERLGRCITSKDLSLYLIRRIGVGGAIGHIVEFSGSAVREMSIEERMTLTNMSIEAGARTAIIEPDEKTFEYVKGRMYSPKGEDWNEAVASWSKLRSDSDSRYDKLITINASQVEPMVTWGTNPSMACSISERVPDPRELRDERERNAVEKALKYMGLSPGTSIEQIKVEVVFIGSCTNGRLSDLILAARFLKGRKVNSNVNALVVPGSMLVRKKAEEIGLDRIFKQAGFEWRYSGCSMCIAMNGDSLLPGQRCASTSNRNFENRQGPGGRTHLVSPLMAAAAAVEGHFVDVREYDIAGIEEIINAD